MFVILKLDKHNDNAIDDFLFAVSLNAAARDAKSKMPELHDKLFELYMTTGDADPTAGSHTILNTETHVYQMLVPAL